MTTYPFRKSDQIERYIGQFMRVFSGFQVQDGVLRDGTYVTKKVPVVYGNMSRIVASVLSKRDHLANASIPIMAANMTGLDIDLDNKRTHHHSDVRSFKKDSNSPYVALERISGPAFTMNMELSIYASSTSELMGLVEQILLIFNPRVTIQTSSDILDSNYITDIILTGVQPDIAYPMGVDSQIVMMTLTFSVPIRIRYPSGENDSIVSQIIANVFSDDNREIETITITGDVNTGSIVTERE